MVASVAEWRGKVGKRGRGVGHFLGVNVYARDRAAFYAVARMELF